MFSSLPFFLTHVQFPPLFSHPCSVVSTFFSNHLQLSPFFSLMFSSQLSPIVFHTFSCLLFFSHIPLPPLFSQTHSVAFSIQKKFSSPFFSHTFSSLPFFLSPRVAFHINKIYIYFSKFPTFFSHFPFLPLFSLVPGLPSTLKKNQTFQSHFHFSPPFFSVCGLAFTIKKNLLKNTFSCPQNTPLFFLVCMLPFPFKQ